MLNSTFRRFVPQRRTVAVWALLSVTAAIAPGLLRGQATTESPAARTEVDPKLQLIGSLASSHVYTTFGYIGIVADNTQKELYPPERVDDLMQEVVVISDSLVKQLEELQKSNLTASDAEAVQEIIEIYKLLNQESESLRAYAKDKSEANGNAFNKLRGTTWPRVAKLVGIPAETPPAK